MTAQNLAWTENLVNETVTLPVERQSEHGKIVEFSRVQKKSAVRKPGFFERKVKELFALAGIRVNGHEPHDITVHNPRFYRRFLTEGRMAFGESYMDGWWDCDRIDEMLCRIFRAKKQIVEHVQTPATLCGVLAGKIIPHGNSRRSQEIGSFHYDTGNDLYESILDPSFQYSCGFWANGATNLQEAQLDKMDRICRKLQLKPGMKLLDVGCGWGGFARFATERYGVKVTGISISKRQLALARKLCEGLPVDFQYLDYRKVDKKYDRIVSIGMFEHVGLRYYRTFFKKMASCLVDDGLFLLHSIGFLSSDFKNPWLQKYIFPGCFCPSLKHIGEANEGLMVLEHMENIGFNYAPTLFTWYTNLEKAKLRLQKSHPEKYSERFFRMWRYYLLSCSAGFRTRKAQVWQFVLSKEGVTGGYVFSE